MDNALSEHTSCEDQIEYEDGIKNRLTQFINTINSLNKAFEDMRAFSANNVAKAISEHPDGTAKNLDQIRLARIEIGDLLYAFSSQARSAKKLFYKPDQSAEVMGVAVVIEQFFQNLKEYREALGNLLKKPRACIKAELNEYPDEYPSLENFVGNLGRIDEELSIIQKSVSTPPKRQKTKEMTAARPAEDFRIHIEKSKASFSNELNYEIACEIAMSLEDQVTEKQNKFQILLYFDDLWEFFHHSNGNHIPIYKFSKQLKALKQDLLVLGIILKGTAQAGGKTPFSMEWGQ